jgi:hypothetical protein
MFLLKGFKFSGGRSNAFSPRSESDSLNLSPVKGIYETSAFYATVRRITTVPLVSLGTRIRTYASNGYVLESVVPGTSLKGLAVTIVR